MDDRPHPTYRFVNVLCAGVAANIVAQVLGPSSAARSEYAKSTRPAFAPPPWVFGVAWPVNNLLTLWGNWRVLNAPASADRTAYIRLQAAAWMLFMSYGLVRFRLKSPILGLGNTVLYTAVIVRSAVRAARIDRRLLASFATLLPWLALATTLALYEMNDSDTLFESHE